MATKVKFTADVTVKTGTDKGVKPESYKKGQTVDFLAMYMADPEMKEIHGDNLAGAAATRAKASAQHWINRGKAEDATAPRKAVGIEEATEEPKEHHAAMPTPQAKK